MTTYKSGEQSSDNRKQASKEITPELVQKIAERVFAMLISELKIENERYRPIMHGPACRKGNKYGI